MSTEKYPWPQWQLTAFVLNELEPEVAAQIQTAADSDPALAAEIAAIRTTVAQVTQLYKHETTGIEPTTFDPVASQRAADLLMTSSSKDPVAFSQKTYLRMNRTALVGLVAMAASLLIAVVLAAPALQNYFAQSTTDVLARAEKVEKVQSTAAAPEGLELPGVVETAKSEMHVPLQVQSLPMSAQPKSQAEVTLLSASGGEAVQIQSDEAKQLASEYRRTRAMGSMGAIGGTDGSLPVDAVAGGGQPAPHPFAESPESPDDSKMGTDVAGMQGSRPMELAKASSTPAVGGMMGGRGSEGGMGMGGMGRNRMAMGGGMGGMGGGMGMGGMGGMEGGMYGGMGASPALYDDVQYSPAGDNEAKHSEEMRSPRPRYPNQPGGDRFAPIYENPFKFVESDPLTTFSIDVDTASYVKARQFLLQSHSLPPANAVRVEEFINYFEYEYAGPQGDDPFAANLAVATCPWRTDHKLVRIALQAKKMDVSERPKANIVFLLDVSGSMDEPNKLPLVKESMRMLIQQLGENDRVAMVVYAGAAGCVLESTTGEKQDVILGALDRLNAGGSTNGGQGIQLAYDIARDNFVPGGVNRVILCTDGDFNVGTTSTEGLVNLVVENAKSKVFLTVLGFGMGNTNDAMMEQISDKGNGVYGFVDSRREAQRQMIKQLAGNLMTVAKDVKIQVEFNPERVASYRLIGYENRKLANEDFANDKKDAGEIGAGHRVTALYEIEPIGAAKVQPAEGLRYQKRKSEVAAEPKAAANEEGSNELLAVSLRYKQPEGDTSKLLTFPLVDSNKPFAEADQDFKWAASVAQFAMLLRNSTHKGSTSWSGLLETAEPLATDESRRECVSMIRMAAGLRGN